MITNNWYKCFKYYFAANNGKLSDSVTVKDYNGEVCSVKTDSSVFLAMFPSSSPNLATVYNKSNFGGVVFGDGTAAPTKDDYKLSGTLLTTISAKSTEITTTDNGDKSTMSISYLIENTGSAPITISEIGWMSKIKANTYSNDKYLMFDHTLLDMPVTIQAGGVGKIIYNRSITLPTA